ncbi:MAG: DUF1800 family protein, partial [Lewinella sp.]|nr:DUF1800 family protein [Lewinella sp.]
MMQDISHLYARAGFGWHPQLLARPPRNTDEAVDALFTAADAAPPLAVVMPDLSQLTDPQERQRLLRELLGGQSLDWIKRMADPAESALLERVSLFWHGHFACRILAGPLAAQYLNTIRSHALGSFRELCLGIARTPAMIRFLNNQQNRKDSPNENFARELMELFTIGRGHYSETDIKEAARAFTGWSSNQRGEFVFRRGQHDFGEKTFFGRTG